MQTANVTKIVSCKQPTDRLRKYLWGVQYTASQIGQCATLDELMLSSLAASQIDRFLGKLKCSLWLLRLMYRTNSPMSHSFTIISLLEPNPVEVKATQNGHNLLMKMGKTSFYTLAC